MSTTTGSTSTTIHDTGTESTYVEQTPKKKSIKHELKFCVAWIEIFQSGEGYLVHKQKKNGRIMHNIQINRNGTVWRCLH